MRTRTRNLKRLLSLALCLSMVTGLLPVTVMAADAPAITTEALETATVGVTYSAELTAIASDPNGELTWEAEGLPNGLALSGIGETAALLGTPIEAGTFTVTVTVTETIPAAEPEDPVEGTEPAEGTEPDQGTDPAEGTEPDQEPVPAEPTVLTVEKVYTLTVAEEVQAEPEPESEPGTAPLLTTGGNTYSTHQSVSATIYTGQGDYGAFTGKTDTFPVDQAGLILDLRSFNQAVSSGWSVESIAFYPTDGSSQWGTVFWFNGTEDYPCDNGTANDKLASNGVFQIQNFTPNGSSGSAGLTPGTYKVLVYVGNGLAQPDYQEILYLSNETFTITSAAGPGKPVINTTTLPDATVGVSYETTLTATAATGGSLSWALASGSSLPAGLALSTDGKISGTPTQAGSYTFTVQVSETVEGETLTATKQFTLQVTEKLEITNQTTQFTLTRGELFTLQLTANQAVTWSFQAGYMPGLRLNGDTISGTVSSSTSSGTYTATMRATAEDGQTADIELTFIVGDLFFFTLPESLPNDMIGHYAYLRATLEDKEVTLWSGTLNRLDQELTVYSAYSGKTVNNVELYVRLNKGGNVEAVLARADSVTLEDGGSSALTASGTASIIALPEFNYGGLGDYVSAWFEDSDGYRYYSGDLATVGMTFTLKASANPNLYRQDGNSGYALNVAPTFGGAGVDGTTYTPSAGTITVTYPRLTKQPVTFTLEPVSEAKPDDLTGAQLSIQQYVNGAAVRTSAPIMSDSTATAELYLGAEATVTLLGTSGRGLKDTEIESVTENHTLEYWTSAQTGTSLLLTPTLASNSEELLTYAESLPRNSIYPTIMVGGESWNIRGGFSSSLSVTKNIGKPLSFGIWNYDYAEEIQSMVDSGGTYSLSWSATQNLLDGKLENQKWPSDQLSASVELPLTLKGGVLLSLTYSGSSAAHLQDWWYSEDGTWITSGNRTSVYSTKGEARNYAFCCPGEEDGTYGFILLPREAQPTGMTWADAAEYYAGMPALADVPVENNTVTSERFTLSEVQAAAARYLTLPNSTLSGPAQFTSTEELLSFTGGIQLDEGVDGKLKTLRIEARGDDGKVAFQISSLQIGGKTYPYAGIHIEGDPVQPDALMNEQFQTYYEITFSEPITLPCTFTLYGNAMSNKSDVKLTLSAVLDDVTGVDTSKLDQWQSLGTATAQGPALSVAIPAAVGTETATAYLTIPGRSSARVDIYDGDTLVVPSARAGEVEIPLVGTSPSRTTSHNLSFRWRTTPPADASGEPYEVTVLHTNGLPTLVSQQLQVQIETDWHTFERDRIYSFTSNDPNPFRAVCEIANSENIRDGKSGVTFLFHLLDGTTVSKQVDSRSGDTFTSEILNTNSPVIAVSVVFETDWDKVNQVLQNSMPALPANSPSRSMANVTFSETVVVPYEEHRIQLPEKDTVQPLTDAEIRAIEAFQDKIEQIYKNNSGQAGFYQIIDIGTEQFTSAHDMITRLDTGYIPQGGTGTTTMTRPLSQQELTTELGSGDWSRYTFTEPDGSTGLEVYTQTVTTGGGAGEGGVSGTITIATDGDTTVEFATAQGTGTGTNPYTLPESGTYPSGGGANGVGGFSFTTFESDGMSVFSNFCGDVTTGSNTIKDITAAITGAEATGIFKPLEQGLGVYSFTKDMMDGVGNEITLMDLLNAPNSWLSSRCAQKLSDDFRTNMQNQINHFIRDVRDAEGWNMAVTGANYVLGAGGMAGLFTNPWTGIIGGAAAWCAGKISGMKLDNVQKQATLLKDTIDLQITKNAIRSNDQECMPKSRGQGNTAPYRVCIDPSGIVYEAVLSNPVKGATVTLYTDGTGYVPEYSENADGLTAMVDGNGNPVRPSNAGNAGSPNLTTPNADDLIPNELILTTGADGRFQWNVQQGLWYVTAEKDGYEPGDSGNDVAAVVSTGSGESTINWLPVLPEQLNVNIPLVSDEPPTVTAEAREDGVYLTFSKYMDDTTLKKENFALTDSEGAPIPIKDVLLLNSEQAPGNINYQGNVPSYTSQVKLALAEGTTLSGEVTVTISPNVVSYAGTPYENGTVSGTFQEGALEVQAPTVTGAEAGQVEYGTTVTLTIPDGAEVYYTTDGTAPSATNGTRYYANQPIVITKSMTLKAVAVKYGEPSEILSVKFTVPGTGGDIPEVPEYPDDPDDEPDTPAIPGGTTGGGSSGYSISVPASTSIKGGSITVSPRSADKGDTITITVKPDDGYELNKLTVTDARGSELELTDKGGGKYTFTMPGSSVKIQVSYKEIAEQAANPFADVYESDYYYEAVLWAVANGVTNGTSATTFSPGVTVTRAQMVTFLWRAYGSPKATGSNSFADVSADAYYYDAVLWAVANGVTNGTSATTFSPDAPVTRSQAVTFQWRAAGSPVVAGDSFDDVAADAYYAGAVAWAVANGITNGTGGNKFSPEVTVTRAQAVTFLWRELA